MLQILKVKKTLVQCYKFLHPLKKKLSVKIFENFSFPSREKINPPVKKSEKVSVRNLDCP